MGCGKFLLKCVAGHTPERAVKGYGETIRGWQCHQRKAFPFWSVAKQASESTWPDFLTWVSLKFLHGTGN